WSGLLEPELVEGGQDDTDHSQIDPDLEDQSGRQVDGAAPREGDLGVQRFEEGTVDEAEDPGGDRDEDPCPDDHRVGELDPGHGGAGGGQVDQSEPGAGDQTADETSADVAVAAHHEIDRPDHDQRQQHAADRTHDQRVVVRVVGGAASADHDPAGAVRGQQTTGVEHCDDDEPGHAQDDEFAQGVEGAVVDEDRVDDVGAAGVLLGVVEEVLAGLRDVAAPGEEVGPQR